MSPAKLLPLLVLGMALSLPSLAAPPDATPRGKFVELHSCELYAGSCVVNSEVDQSGNYLLRAWQFDAGTENGVPLNGLTVALLEKGDNTLAVPKHAASDAVAYLPANLTDAQRTALLAFARRQTAAKLDDRHVRTVAMQVDFDATKPGLTLGKTITFSGVTPPVCNAGGCGEMLWYTPRGGASSFVVDQLDTSRVIEPLLSLQWEDHGRQTLFVGRFGDPEPTIPGICGAPRTAALTR